MNYHIVYVVVYVVVYDLKKSGCAFLHTHFLYLHRIELIPHDIPHILEDTQILLQ